MKRHIKNYLFLIFCQGLGFLMPLIMLPFLTAKLGLELYGIVIFSQSLSLLLVVITEFGFSLSATKEIAKYSKNNKKIGEIVSSVFILKIILMFLSFMFYCFIIFYSDKLNTHYDIFLLSFLTVIGQIFIPSFLFIGLEKIKDFAKINIVSRLVTMSIILLMVKTKSDYIIIPLAYFLGYILASFISLILIKNHYKLKIEYQPLRRLINTFKNSIPYFSSRLSYDGSQYFAITMLGFFFSSELIAFYSVAEKFYIAVNGIFSPLSKILYPYMVKTKNVKVFKKIILIVFLSLSVVIMIFFINIEIITEFLSGENNEKIIFLSKILLTSSCFSVFSIILGYPLLGAYDYQKHVNNSVIIGSIGYIIMICIFIYKYENIFYVAMSFAVYHLFILIYRIYYIKKYKLL